MYTNRAEKALRCVAEKHGVSVEKVRKDIQRAIVEAMHSDNPSVRARWRMLFPEGGAPTPEQLIEKLSSVYAATK